MDLYQKNEIYLVVNAFILGLVNIYWYFTIITYSHVESSFSSSK